MKLIIKTIATVTASTLFFIVGDVALKGAWLNKMDNFDFMLNHRIGVDKPQQKILFVTLVAEGDSMFNRNLFDGLQIQLMNSEYSELKKATVKNGIAQFNLSEIKKNNAELILISPTTSNELIIETNSLYVNMPIDISEIMIKQKANL
jgi:hypothetical protein